MTRDVDRLASYDPDKGLRYSRFIVALLYRASLVILDAVDYLVLNLARGEDYGRIKRTAVDYKKVNENADKDFNPDADADIAKVRTRSAPGYFPVLAREPSLTLFNLNRYSSPPYLPGLDSSLRYRVVDTSVAYMSVTYVYCRGTFTDFVL
ncbi:hypothetical protein QBC39DRAFT_333461 [Podospora conica]|nr:hypothetical protein QBC39DRAFT_333461 [Schizothecium conicum]